MSEREENFLHWTLGLIIGLGVGSVLGGLGLIPAVVIVMVIFGFMALRKIFINRTAT